MPKYVAYLTLAVEFTASSEEEAEMRAEAIAEAVTVGKRGTMPWIDNVEPAEVEFEEDH